MWVLYGGGRLGKYTSKRDELITSNNIVLFGNTHRQGGGQLITSRAGYKTELTTETWF